MSMSASQREEFHSILKAYFEAKDYKFEKPLGRGSYGLVFKIGTPDGQKYALKISQYDNLFLDKDYQWDDERDEEILPTEVLQFQRELNWLNLFGGCDHIVQQFWTDDPLRLDPPDDVEPHGMETWHNLELLENGTLMDLKTRLIGSPTPPVLQNRILWRFFMCFIRACIEMAYPYESGVSEFDRGDVGLESLRDKEPGNVLHNDVSLNNVCIGPFQTSGDFEHSITPVLKMIDFGQTVRLEEEEEEEQEEAEDEEDEEMNDDSDTSDDSERSDDEPMDEAPVEDAPMDDVQAGDAANPDGNDQDNGDKTQERTIERVAWQITLKNMAAIIAGLVLLPICGFSSYNSAVEVTLKDGRSILSNCSKLTGQTRTSLLTAGVDPDLIDLLYQCLAEDHNDIPKLIDLALYVRKQIVEKG